MKISADTFCKIATKRRSNGATGRRGDSGNPIPPTPSLRRLIALFPLIIVFFIACGKVGDPLAPLPRAPLHVDDLVVQQLGANLILSFPFKRESRTKLQRIDVYRLVEPLDAPMGLPIETFSERASVISTILADDVPLGRSG